MNILADKHAEALNRRSYLRKDFLKTIKQNKMILESRLKYRNHNLQISILLL